MRRVVPIWAAAVLAIVGSAGAQQSEPPAADAPRIFLDCGYYCDSDFIRTEMSWLNWVRDRADAQVHVLVTRQSTGGGGAEWTMNFIGLKEFEGRSDTLKYVSATNDSEDVIRQGMVRVLKAGVIPYVMNTSLAGRLQIRLDSAAASKSSSNPSQAARDPWNYWVFSLGLRSNLDGEASQRFANYNGNFSASRTTPGLKIRLSTNGSYNEQNFTIVEDSVESEIVSIRRNYNVNLLVVKSIGPHWSAGIQSSATSATFGNVSLGLNGGPALEFSYWPYEEATRRSLAFRYSLGVKRFDYRELTIFDKLAETHPSHNLSSELSLRQRWGSTSFVMNVSQYLHDTRKYNASLFGNANIKLFKGFSLDFYGEYARVRDQLSLPKRELEEEEILLRQRQLATNYRYWGGFGIRYSFGSIFNNVVNPRFGEGGGSIIIM